MAFRYSFVVILAIFLTTLRGGDGQNAFPNIGYLGRGYDIFKGNPDATGVRADPGFRSTVYSLQQYGSNLTPDRRFKIPNGVEVFTAEVCDVSFHSKIVENTKTYSDLLRTKVSMSAEGSFKGFGASFSASVDYKRIEKTTKNTRDVYTISSAMCSKYSAHLLEYTPPPLYANFIQGIKSLPATYDEKAYMKFLYYFGTHVVQGVLMGAKCGQVSEMSRRSYDRLVETDTKIETSASVSAFMATVSTSVLTEKQKKEGEKFKEATKSQKIFSFGAKPPTDGKAVTWANRVFDNPMPLSYTLKRVDEVLTDQNVKGIGKLSTLRASLQKALREYCPYLKRIGQIRNCDPPTTPRPLPPPKPKTCRLCQSCASSGDYSNVAGVLVHEGDWGPYDMYPAGCKGRYTRSWNEPHLCCTGQYAACRLCSSCGANWPAEVGMKENVGDWGPWVTYGSGCTGSYTKRWSPFKICCKNFDSCRMCTSCGKGMEEIGRVVHQGDWGRWKMFNAANCIPGARTGYYSPNYSRVEPVFCCPKSGI